jgi:mRNA-degrading endonuclease YafQ of YafQ-DinJ toxin-antitoxin module
VIQISSSDRIRLSLFGSPLPDYKTVEECNITNDCNIPWQIQKDENRIYVEDVLMPVLLAK